ncbi:MAG: D-sedoheptulose 7-phosphate isomerase [Saprospiraceae bacterium]|nr:D-sedoheptulose 7-phosphate isomerase [Saprospiraceae bacterium]
MKSIILKTFSDHLQVTEDLFRNEYVIAALEQAAQNCIQALKKGNKILFCGNGGSAADAQHLAAELSGRYLKDRSPLFAEALHVNSSYLTAVGNDYGFEEIFARAVLAKGKKGDVLVGLSTSGTSANVIRAFVEAKRIGLQTISMTGLTGGELKALSDIWLAVPSEETPRIQECHIVMGHILCNLIEEVIFP